MAAYDRSRDRTEPDEGHVARVLQRAYHRRDAWARNEPPDGVGEVWVDRNFGGRLRFWLCPLCDRRCRFVYATSSTWFCHKCTERSYRSALSGPGDDRNLTVAANRRDEFARRHPDAVEVTGPGRTRVRQREPGRHFSRWGRIHRELYQREIDFLKACEASIDTLERSGGQGSQKRPGAFGETRFAPQQDAMSPYDERHGPPI